MSLAEQIQADMKEAMKLQDAVKLSVLRMLTSAIKNQAIELKKENLDDQDILKVIKSEIKKRKDSVDAYVQGGRDDLAQQERQEIQVLEAYLPEQMSEQEIQVKVQEIVSGLPEDKKNNFGVAMGVVMKEIGSMADGNKVREVLQKLLQQS